MADQALTPKTYPLQYLIAALALGLIAGVLVSSLWNRTKERSTTSDSISDIPITLGTTEATTPAKEISDMNQNAMLTISDQGAGLSVVVAKADVGEDAWVVIHEDRMGQPSNVLGAARFVGKTTSGTVELLRGTIEGQTYHGLIYKDDGDRIFSMERDTPLRDTRGNPILVTFKAN